MKQIDSKSMEKLEYSKVINELSGHTVSDLGSQKAREIRPEITHDKVERMLEETDDAVTILRLKGGIPLGSFHDVRPYVKRMEISAVLSGQELIQIGQLLKGMHEIIDFFMGLKKEAITLRHLYELVDELIELPQLQRRIYATLTDGGSVLDDASSQLKSIRTSMRQTESNVREKLNSIVRGSQAKHLTDSIITMRNDRFVIPVKSESRAVFGGVVHDQSSSGQTVFIEPQSVLDLNNKLKRLESEEKYEVDRILAELSGEILPHAADILTNLTLLIDLDVVQAKARYARELKATRPNVSTENLIELFKARHPLISEDEIVPNDIALGGAYKTIVVTGPNTGGKTVILKTLGLLQMMGQSGLYLPVEEESSIGVFNHILSDIGDEQSIEQSLSTFSSHLTTIVSVLEVIDKDSLILFDELGAGTDPQEGAALAIAILDHIGAVGSYAMITSHYPELKLYGYNRPETMNASMEFDIDTLSPTYKFKMGVPGRSNAFEIARRLGLDNGIIDTARTLMTSESQSVDEMIQDLNDRQQEAESHANALRQELLDAQKLHSELKREYSDYQSEKDTLIEKAKAEANRIVESTKRKADEIIEDIRQKQLEGSTGQGIKEHEFIDTQSQISRLKQEEALLKKNKVLQKQKEKKVLREGQSVKVQSLGQQGILVEKVDDQWVVQMGMLKMKLPEEDLIVTEEEKVKTTSTFTGSISTVGSEVDLRGERVEAALSRLSQYLDSALLSNYQKVTVIHGHGTGAVRSAVHEALKKHPRVKKYETAPANQGGTGATIVTFK